jgi:hypothetical protein
MEAKLFLPPGVGAEVESVARRSICVLAGSKDLSVNFWLSPGAEIECVERNAEQIGGDKAELRRAESDDAYDGAVDGGKNPTFPAALA